MELRQVGVANLHGPLRLLLASNTKEPWLGCHHGCAPGSRGLLACMLLRSGAAQQCPRMPVRCTCDALLTTGLEKISPFAVAIQMAKALGIHKCRKARAQGEKVWESVSRG